MAEKKTGKKFVQKPKLRNITLSGKKRQRKKLL